MLHRAWKGGSLNTVLLRCRRGARAGGVFRDRKADESNRQRSRERAQGRASAEARQDAGASAEQEGVEYEAWQQPFFSDLPLDRAGHIRADSALVEELWRSGSAQVVPMWKGHNLARQLPAASGREAAPKLAMVTLPAAGVGALDTRVGHVFLGLRRAGGEAVFAVELAGDAEADALAEARAAEWVKLRSAAKQLGRQDAAVLALAAGLIAWHRSHLFDARTGAPMESASGGHQRRASAAGRGVYPRLDPAVMMLVTCGDWALLGRKAAWPASRFSCLAGFCEVGETLEQTVVREVLEESAVEVDPARIRYVGSQPWPFPQSLMIGFVAEALPAAGADEGTSPDLKACLSLDGWRAAKEQGITEPELLQLRPPALQPPQPQADELEQVHWFHRDLLRSMLHGTQSCHGMRLRVPGDTALAHHIIGGWLREPQQQPQAVAALRALRAVEVDKGVYKYVLVRVTDTGGCRKLLVRGCRSADYHMDLVLQLKSQVRSQGIDVEPLGGGRIEHYPDQRVIHVYGFSQAFGPAPHEATVWLLRRAFPLYQPADITCSYSGY